jgi:uncharacterized protein (TIGR02270 family)
MSEAAWLWQQWEESLDSAVYSLDEVVGDTERRLLAHLDGLVYGGLPVAERILSAALASDDPGEVAVATWCLVQAEDADHQDTVFDVMCSAEPSKQVVMGRALWLSSRVDLSRLVPLWSSGTPLLRAMVLDLFAPREAEWVRERLDQALRSGAPPVVAAALRAIRRFRDRAFLSHVQSLLDRPHPEYLSELIGTGLVLGERKAWQVCREASERSGDSCRYPLALLATSPDANDRAAVCKKTSDAVVGRHAVWALGFAGDAASAEVLLQAMSNASHAKIAAEAFSAISGLAIAGGLESSDEAPTKDVRPEDPPPVVRSEDDLPQPRVEAVRQWWAKERARFLPGIRYIHGQPRKAAPLKAALRTAHTWRREVLLVELASAGEVPKIELKGWGREQLPLLGGLSRA